MRIMIHFILKYDQHFILFKTEQIEQCNCDNVSLLNLFRFKDLSLIPMTLKHKIVIVTR